jgi:DNA primase small subunit
VPERFRGESVRIDVTEPGTVEFDGESLTVESGECTVRECLAVFLMARGRAEKVPEAR